MRKSSSADARKLYQELKRLTEGSKPGASSCKDENGNLVTRRLEHQFRLRK